MTEHHPSPLDEDLCGSIHHISSVAPLPLMLSDSTILSSVNYRRRTNVPKSSIHWGQRKLLLSELQFLMLYTNPRHVLHPGSLVESREQTAEANHTPRIVHKDPCCLVVYAGSAPGTHLLTMPEIFPIFFANFHFELHDPRKFDQNLYEWEKICALNSPVNDCFSRGGITICNGYFDDSTALDVLRRRLNKRKSLQFLFQCLFQDNTPESDSSFLDSNHCALKLLLYAAAEDTPLLFISDIRTGSLTSMVTEEDFDLQFKNEKFENEVKKNMNDQLRWHQIMQPKHSMLKFRLPYVDHDTDTRKKPEDECTQYLSGDIILPIWTRPTSSECRLVTNSVGILGKSLTATFPPVQMSIYGNHEYQDQLYYFNSVVRECFHYNHFYNLKELNGRKSSTKRLRTSNEQVRNLDLDHRYDASMELEILSAAIIVEKLAESGNVPPENIQGEDKFHWLMREGLRLVLGNSPRHQVYNDALVLSQQITKALRRTFDNAIRAREEIILEKARSCSWTESALQLIKTQRENREQSCWWKNIEEE